MDVSICQYGKKKSENFFDLCCIQSGCYDHMLWLHVQSDISGAFTEINEFLGGQCQIVFGAVVLEKNFPCRDWAVIDGIVRVNDEVSGSL